MRIQDNSAQYLAGLRDIVPQRKRWQVAILNTQPYAIYLHNMNGYSVINTEPFMQNVVQAIRSVLLKPRVTNTDFREALLDAGKVTIEAFQERTARMAPPIRAGGPQRPRHPRPLNWADRTTKLASSYAVEVNRRHRRTPPYDGEAFE